MRKTYRYAQAAAMGCLLALVSNALADEKTPARSETNVVTEVLTVSPAPAPAAELAAPQPIPPAVTQVQRVPDPLPSSQPVPFSIPPEGKPEGKPETKPDGPAATNDQNFFSGFPNPQDLSDLLPGNFKNTK